MGPRHSKEQLLSGALELALADGLSQLTFGRLARHLDVSDRMLVYYFATKDALITEVVLSMGARLQGSLETVFTEAAADHRELLRSAWPVLSDGGTDAVFGLFFEANGLAVAGREPYATLVPQLVELWIDWVAGFIDADDAERRAEAETAVALVDGLLLLRLLAGGDAAHRAAQRLGIA